jgi:hypothetical protein
MTRAEEDALLSDLAEADHYVRWWLLRNVTRDELDRAYVAKLLRHALQIVEPKKDQERV